MKILHLSDLHLGRRMYNYSFLPQQKKLLADGQNTLEEIAEQCGYHSEIYFMQQFKKETGMTPTQYRTKGNAE